MSKRLVLIERMGDYESTCVQNTRALASSPLLSPQRPQSPHPNHLSKHLLNAAQVIHMGAQPVNNAHGLTVPTAQPVHMCPNPAQPSVHVLTVHSSVHMCTQCTASAHVPKPSIQPWNHLAHHLLICNRRKSHQRRRLCPRWAQLLQNSPLSANFIPRQRQTERACLL